MKLRAIHLLNRMERIERDLNEIATLRSTLQDDREYTTRLRASLQDETVRLRELESKILSQVIQNPPASLQNRSASAGRNQASPRNASSVNAPPPARAHRPPEIIVPPANGPGEAHQASGKKKSAHAPTAPVKSGARNKNRPESDAENGNGDEEGFNFTFVQK